MDIDISLKKPTVDDLDFILGLWSDPRTMEAVGGPIRLSLEEAKTWFAEKISPGSPQDCYRLILDPAQTPVGEISFHRLDAGTMTADFNVKIASQYRQKGYARQAMWIFLDYFFNEFGGKTIQDQVSLENPVGKTALLNFGFSEVPTEGEYFLLVLTREEFNKLAPPKRGINPIRQA